MFLQCSDMPRSGFVNRRSSVQSRPLAPVLQPLLPLGAERRPSRNSLKNPAKTGRTSQRLEPICPSLPTLRRQADENSVLSQADIAAGVPASIEPEEQGITLGEGDVRYAIGETAANVIQGANSALEPFFNRSMSTASEWPRSDLVSTPRAFRDRALRLGRGVGRPELGWVDKDRPVVPDGDLHAHAGTSGAQFVRVARAPTRSA